MTLENYFSSTIPSGDMPTILPDGSIDPEDDMYKFVLRVKDFDTEDMVSEAMRILRNENYLTYEYFIAASSYVAKAVLLNAPYDLPIGPYIKGLTGWINVVAAFIIANLPESAWAGGMPAIVRSNKNYFLMASGQYRKNFKDRDSVAEDFITSRIPFEEYILITHLPAINIIAREIRTNHTSKNAISSYVTAEIMIEMSVSFPGTFLPSAIQRANWVMNMKAAGYPTGELPSMVTTDYSQTAWQSVSGTADNICDSREKMIVPVRCLINEIEFVERNKDDEEECHDEMVREWRLAQDYEHDYDDGQEYDDMYYGADEFANNNLDDWYRI